MDRALAVGGCREGNAFICGDALLWMQNDEGIPRRLGSQSRLINMEYDSEDHKMWTFDSWADIESVSVS